MTHEELNGWAILWMLLGVICGIALVVEWAWHQHVKPWMCQFPKLRRFWMWWNPYSIKIYEQFHRNYY